MLGCSVCVDGKIELWTKGGRSLHGQNAARFACGGLGADYGDGESGSLEAELNERLDCRVSQGVQYGGDYAGLIS